MPCQAPPQLMLILNHWQVIHRGSGLTLKPSRCPCLHMIRIGGLKCVKLNPLMCMYIYLQDPLELWQATALYVRCSKSMVAEKVTFWFAFSHSVFAFGIAYSHSALRIPIYHSVFAFGIVNPIYRSGFAFSHSGFARDCVSLRIPQLLAAFIVTLILAHWGCYTPPLWDPCWNMQSRCGTLTC